MSGEPDQRGAQCGVGGLGIVAGGHRHEQLETGDRVVRDPSDRVDVDVQCGQRARRFSKGVRGDRPTQHQDDMRGTAGVSSHRAGADLNLQLHPDAGHGLLGGLLEIFRISSGGDQHAENDPAPDHHLLDVEDLHPVLGKRREDDRHDPRLVPSGDRHQQGCPWVSDHLSPGSSISSCSTACAAFSLAATGWPRPPICPSSRIRSIMCG